MLWGGLPIYGHRHKFDCFLNGVEVVFDDRFIS
jgi:hypothetical protein